MGNPEVAVKELCYSCAPCSLKFSFETPTSRSMVDAKSHHVNILQVNHGGQFLANPFFSSQDADTYNVFLADLNNYMNECTRKGEVYSSQNFKNGEIVAAYCKRDADDTDKLWYRGRVLMKLKNIHGITAKILLVDHNSIVFVPGICLRSLKPKYQNFPVQMMKCQFYGLQPITYAATFDSLVSQQVATQWDLSVKTRLHQLTEGSFCRVTVHEVDREGVFRVTLYVSTFDDVGRQIETNINELLVEEKYAVYEERGNPDLEKIQMQESSDDAASTISDSSNRSVDTLQKNEAPEQSRNLAEQKKIELERFYLAIESALDQFPVEHVQSTNQDQASDLSGHLSSKSRSDIVNPDPAKSILHSKVSAEMDSAAPVAKPSDIKMMPASCEDGINMTDFSPHVNCHISTANRKAATRQLMRELMGSDESDDGPPGVEEIKTPLVPNGNPAGSFSNVRTEPKIPINEKRPSWNRIDASVRGAQTSSLSTKIKDPRLQKTVDVFKNDVGSTSESSLTSDDFKAGEREAISKPRSPKKGLIPIQTMRYENECLRQQFKNQVDENSFRTNIDSWELLKALGGSPSLSKSNSVKNQAKISTPTMYQDVLVSGDSKPKCAFSFSELDIPDWLRLSLRDRKTRAVIAKPTTLQSYLWPSAIRGRHVVGIDGAKCGKTVGYLVPILKQIVDTPQLYENLPKETGPIVLILTPDWNEARNIHEICEKILYTYRKKFRTKLLFGGRGKMQEEMVSLINGCEVLVATLPSLVNMLEKRCTNLERLCHLVFDDAEILVEMFEDDIKILMRLYAESLSKTIALNLPHQMVAVGAEWSRGLESLTSAYFDNPLVVIPNTLEAAVFKQVKQHVEVCPANQRLELLMGYLQGDYADQKTVIFTNSARETDDLGKLLESHCIAALKATEFMSPTELMDVEENWNYTVQSKKTSDTVLVLTDRAALRMSVRNATFVVHFEFPGKKSEFGNRLACLLGAMQVKDETSDDSQGVSSLVFMTEESESCAPSLVKLLKRARQHIPTVLQALSVKVSEEKEERAKRCDICSDLKYFGTCRDFQKCSQRHTIFDSDEPKNIPKRGVVKIKILDVVNANVYWGKIVDHQLPFGADKHEEYDTKAYFNLAYDMQVYYTMKSNQVRHGLTPEGVLVDDVCVIKTEDGFRRVRVESILKRDSQTAIATEVSIFGIDCALSTKIQVEKLLLLPTDKSFSLQALPAQAIELIVCGVKPVDQAYSWTVEACLKVNKLICGKTLEGKIALGLRNTLWLDPLVEKTKYDGLNANVTTLHVGSMLLEFGFAVRNKAHVKSIRELCKDCLPSVINVKSECEQTLNPSSNFKTSEMSSNQENTYEHMTLPETGYHDVYVSAVDSPSLFYVELASDVSSLDRLEDKIEAVMNVLPKHEESGIGCLGHGSICLGKFTIDDKWYRARVLEVNDKEEFHVFYVDHGDREWIPSSRIWCAWPEILELPFQAIECSLVHISPKGSEWTTEDGDCLWDLCQGKLLVSKPDLIADFTTDFPKGAILNFIDPLYSDSKEIVVALVSSECQSEYAGTARYNIELLDTTGKTMVNMSHELVFLDRAHGTQECIQDIFPDALWCAENREWMNEIECVPDICLQIYRSEVVPDQLKLAEKLRRIITEFEGTVDELSGCVKSIVKVMALACVRDVVTVLLDVIVKMIDKDGRVLEDIKREGGIKVLCSLLSKEPDLGDSEKTLRLLRFFATDKRSKDSINIYGGLKAICDILKERKSNEVTTSTLECLSALCEQNDQNCLYVMEVGCLETLVSLIKDSTDEPLLEQITYALYVLSKNAKIRDRLLQEQALDTLNNLITKTTNKKCLRNSLETLKNSADGNQMLREYIRKAGIIPKLEKIVFKPMAHGFEVKRLCGDLLKTLKIPADVTGSGQRTVQIRKIKETEKPSKVIPKDDLPRRSPKTLWSDSSKEIKVSIQLRSVKNETVRITEKRLYFRPFVNMALGMEAPALRTPLAMVAMYLANYVTVLAKNKQ